MRIDVHWAIDPFLFCSQSTHYMLPIYDEIKTFPITRFFLFEDIDNAC